MAEKKAKKVAKYQVIEDNGGGLRLFVFRASKVIYEHSGYETTQGQLKADVQALEAGEDPATWEGCEANPQADYDNLMAYQYGYKIVASNGKIFPERMGRAAAREFGVDIN